MPKVELKGARNDRQSNTLVTALEAAGRDFARVARRRTPGNGADIGAAGAHLAAMAGLLLACRKVPPDGSR